MIDLRRPQGPRRASSGAIRSSGPNAAAALLALALAGCAGLGAETAGPASSASAGRPTADAPPTVELSSALRCVDQQLRDSGLRDATLVVGDIVDGSGRPIAATRDAAIAAIADMTVRSRALRVRTDSAATGRAYLLRGTATDQSLQLGMSVDATVLAGVQSRSKLVRQAQAQGVEVQKLGATFRLPASTSQGPPRALVELASIELIGRLARVPYWRCLGVGDGPEVDTEMRDWFDALADQPSELIGWFQQRMVGRGYDGPIDGTANLPFKDAVLRYRDALGLPVERSLSFELFRGLLAADPNTLVERVRRATPVEATLASGPARPSGPALGPPPSAGASSSAIPGGAPFALRVAALGAGARFSPREAVRLAVRPTRDAHVYCFLQDDTQQIHRIFPNPRRPDSRVEAAGGLLLPGGMGFRIEMNVRGLRETVQCFATPRDVLAELPRTIVGQDFQPLAVRSLAQVHAAFAQVAGASLVHDQLVMMPK